MLATSVRDRPCSDLCNVSSDGRDTVIVLPSIATLISWWITRLSSPFGPFADTLLPSILTVTPAGTVIGSFPIRDIVGSLPDEGQQLTAGALRARLAVRHQALRGGQDGHAESVAHARNLAGANVLTKSRRRHAAQL